MANIIAPKRSSVPGAVPSTAALADGEIAVNLNDRKVYMRSGTSVVEVAGLYSPKLALCRLTRRRFCPATLVNIA